MKKQFSPRRNRNSVGVITAIVSVVIIGLLLLGIRVFLPDAFMALATPLWEGGAALEGGFGTTFTGFTHGGTLAAQNQVLSTEVTTLENENAVLTSRDQDLTKLLGSMPTQPGGSLVAGVLARPPLSPYDTLVVAAGAQEGVKKDAEVFAQGGIPIGTIQSETTNTAIVQLNSTSGKSINGWVGNNRLAITLTGTGSGTYSATLPKQIPLSVGDTVYIPGPGAVPMGTIVRIDSDPSSPNDVLHIQPLVNIFSLTWVTIAS